MLFLHTLFLLRHAPSQISFKIHPHPYFVENNSSIIQMLLFFLIYSWLNVHFSDFKKFDELQNQLHVINPSHFVSQPDCGSVFATSPHTIYSAPGDQAHFSWRLNIPTTDVAFIKCYYERDIIFSSIRSPNTLNHNVKLGSSYRHRASGFVNQFDFGFDLESVQQVDAKGMYRCSVIIDSQSCEVVLQLSVNSKYIRFIFTYSCISLSILLEEYIIHIYYYHVNIIWHCDFLNDYFE